MILVADSGATKTDWCLIDEKGERIPLTICDYDAGKGTVTIVVQVVGASTLRMSGLKAGDYFRDFVGPLGNPSELIAESSEELKKKTNSSTDTAYENLLSQANQIIRQMIDSEKQR